MVWGTRYPGTFGICNFLRNFNGKQTKLILPNDNPNHQIPEHSV